jgi:AntA/AntB antirepressor
VGATRGAVKGDLIETVNGRDLHAPFTKGKKTDYSHWVKAQIKRCRLEQGIDFITVVETDDGRPGDRNSDGTQAATEYFFATRGLRSNLIRLRAPNLRALDRS